MIQKILFFFSLLFLLHSCKDQYRLDVKQTLRLSNLDSTVESGFTAANNIKKYDEDKTYYWTDRYKIFQTQGFASDLVLDGEFRIYYRSGQLFEKGNFKNGLKSGLWLLWNENGSLKKKAMWKNWNLNGESVSIDQDTTINSNYKQGLQHGYQKIYVNEIFVQKRKYKKGSLINVEDLNNDEPHVPNDTLTMDAQLPTLTDSLASRKLFDFKLFKKQRDDIE